ncbi:MAG: AAA family ATPase [Parcubacteria group bacterium]|nr:AAA family ATPase [Parcubacteria group bacterium]
MRLKKLEISGFKSFAHKTDLEFPTAVSAIVGPNGSGKSNVVDAVRWVLGEQSFKNLRSKSGADLIWAGSTTRSAQGKASVNLYFDNKDGFFPIDFEEVIIGRKVYRDGANEYYLNGSLVRLKDIAELLARSKLGLRGHSIVNQGSADEILKSNPEERRGILEEALGLREFQLKKSEAEDKLTETGANIEKTHGLLSEIFPHLRSLKRQVEKFKKREFLVSDLNNFENEFFKAKFFEILSDKNKNKKAREALELKIIAARENFETKEKLFEVRMAEVFQIGGKTKQMEADLERLNTERQSVMREIGSLEGLAQHAKRNNNNTKTLEAVLAIKIKYWAKRLNAVFGLKTINDIKEIIRTLADEIQNIGNYLIKNETDKILASVSLADLEGPDKNPYEKDTDELKIRLEQLENQAKQIQITIAKIRLEENNWRTDYLNSQKELELARREYFSSQDIIRGFDLEDEKIKLKEADIKSEMWGSGKNYEEFTATFAAVEPVKILEAEFSTLTEFQITELQNKIIKLRREISDIGSIDEEVMREYEETGKRHEFLTAEVDDLNRATQSLKNLIGDLTIRINNDFKDGLERINKEFHHYFRLMFGGGSAKLTIDDFGESGFGANITINIPQKRIKDLNLLSGGERSLVSIALLFAIVSASKPPFLVLDEIDAALDEVNAARFAKVLEDLAKDTQFILITHNRATMEAAKILYGITMDGDGVSKLFSLKLEEAVL